MRLRVAALLALALVLGIAVRPDPLRSADKPAATPSQFGSKLAPFLEANCISCHNAKKAQGSLDLSVYKDEAGLVKDRAVWEGVVERVRAKEMPPPKKPQPSDADRAAALAWVEKTLNESTCTGPLNPGRVTMRRLNRLEYNNTVRDLVGVDFHPADDFPDDPSGYGFDTIGDVLSMSPLLMEKYLTAAEQVVAKAFAPDPGPEATARRMNASEFRLGYRPLQKVRGQTRMPLTTRDAMVGQFTFPLPGEYAVKIGATGVLVGKDAPKLVFSVDGKEVRSFELKPGAGKKGGGQPLETAVKVTAGPHKLSVALANPYSDPKEKDADKRDRTAMFDYVDVEGPANLPPPQPSAAYKRIMIAAPGTTPATRADAARRILTAFARRAFRRPATSDEVERLVKLVQLAEKSGDSFDAGIQLAIEAVLTSPHFLFRVEVDRNTEVGQPAYRVTDLELAARLSYFLWSSTPDDELLRLAQAGQLSKPATLDAQVRRMLKDAKAGALGENFAAQWLQVRNLKGMTPDGKLFPDFDDKLRDAMTQETSLFFGHVVKEDRPIFDFLDADYTFANERLAKHYGLKGVSGDSFRKVSLAGTGRGGVLTHASVLTVTSNPTRTSPVKRGKFIMENLLNATIPPPPPDAGELEDDNHKLTGTLRQKMEQHRHNPSCASCHQRMDPLGFAFEHYDAVGAWREKDGKLRIETQGELADGTKFADAAELRAVLKKGDEKFRRCLVEKLMTFGLGRGLEHSDRCAVDKACAQVKSGGDKFSAVVLAIVQSDPFQMRSRARGIAK